jgi:hypothetical protein
MRAAGVARGDFCCDAGGAVDDAVMCVCECLCRGDDGSPFDRRGDAGAAAVAVASVESRGDVDVVR